MSAAFWKGLVRSYLHGFAIGSAIVLVWAVVAQAVFAFRNPHLTDTERFLRFWGAMRFEGVEP